MELKILFVLLAVVSITSAVPFAESTLWDLLITVNIQNDPLLEGQDPLIAGHVTDHAGKPIVNATIQIRSGPNTVYTTTNESGKFTYEFVGLDLIPGEHVVNVMATSLENKIGLAGQNFQVKGELSVSSHTARLLETEEAKKYLNSNPEDFEKNPIGLTLYNYYQELQAKFLEEEMMQSKIIETRNELAGTRAISDEREKQIIEEKNPGAGTFTGIKKDIFIDNLHPEIRELVSKQMNFTVSVFEAAQKAMNDVLANGGTYEEARQAYFEKAAVTRQMMEIVTYGNQTAQEVNEPQLLNSTNITNATITEIQEIEEVLLNINGTNIQVGLSGTTIFLNVNGTLVEFIINGTQIIPVTNSTSN